MPEQDLKCRCGKPVQVASVTTPFATRALAMCLECDLIVNLSSGGGQYTSAQLAKRAEAAWRAAFENFDEKEGCAE